MLRFVIQWIYFFLSQNVLICLENMWRRLYSRNLRGRKREWVLADPLLVLRFYFHRIMCFFLRHLLFMAWCAPNKIQIIFTFTEPWCPEVRWQAPQRGQLLISQFVCLLSLKLWNFSSELTSYADSGFAVPHGANWQPPNEPEEGHVWVKQARRIFRPRK